jgi:hypothetical protein
MPKGEVHEAIYSHDSYVQYLNSSHKKLVYGGILNAKVEYGSSLNSTDVINMFFRMGQQQVKMTEFW